MPPENADQAIQEATRFWNEYVNPVEFRGYAATVQTDASPEIILSGPAGTGKTRANLNKLYRCAQQHPGFRGAIMRQTRSSLSDTGLVTWERDVLGSDHDLVVNGPQRQWRHTYRFDNGSEVVCGGLDKPSRVLSAEYDIILVIQAEEVYEADWELLSTRLRNHRMPYQQMLGDCNPEHPQHWIRQREQSGTLALWHTRHEDNPLLWDGDRWTEYGVDYLLRLDRLTGTRKARLRYGQWVQAEGVVYDEFSEAVHVTHRDRSEFVRYVAGIDEGYTNPAVCLVVGVDSDGRMHVCEEYYQRGVRQEAFVEAVAEMIEPYGQVPVYVDPSAAGLIASLTAANVAASPADNAVFDGIQAVKRMLAVAGDGRPRLTIEKTCINMISECGMYAWKERRSGQVDEPEKINDHAMDALRYVVKSEALAVTEDMFTWA